LLRLLLTKLSPRPGILLSLTPQQCLGNLTQSALFLREFDFFIPWSGDQLFQLRDFLAQRSGYGQFFLDVRLQAVLNSSESALDSVAKEGIMLHILPDMETQV